VDYFSLALTAVLLFQAGIENPAMTSQQVREVGSDPDDDDSGCAGFSNSSSDDGSDSKQSSDASDFGESLAMCVIYLFIYMFVDYILRQSTIIAFWAFDSPQLAKT